MPVELLIKAVNDPFSDRKMQKGEIYTVRDVDKLAAWPWGGLEGLPNFVRVRISDATEAQIKAYMSRIYDILQWDLLAENSQGRRYRVYLHPKVIQFGGMKERFRDVLIGEHDATVVSSDLPNGEAVFDIPNTDWQALRDQLLYDVTEAVAESRYRFTPASVDALVNAGGYAERTKAQVLANIVDRLA